MRWLFRLMFLLLLVAGLAASEPQLWPVDAWRERQRRQRLFHQDREARRLAHGDVLPDDRPDRIQERVEINEVEDDDDDDVPKLNVSAKDSPYALINRFFPEREANHERMRDQFVDRFEAGQVVEDIGALEPQEVWLADGDLLVLKGGSTNDRDGFDDPWDPIDDYQAPYREPKLPPADFIPQEVGVGIPLPPEEDEDVIGDVIKEEPKAIVKELKQLSYDPFVFPSTPAPFVSGTPAPFRLGSVTPSSFEEGPISFGTDEEQKFIKEMENFHSVRSDQFKSLHDEIIQKFSNHTQTILNGATPSPLFNGATPTPLYNGATPTPVPRFNVRPNPFSTTPAPAEVTHSFSTTPAPEVSHFISTPHSYSFAYVTTPTPAPQPIKTHPTHHSHHPTPQHFVPAPHYPSTPLSNYPSPAPFIATTPLPSAAPPPPPFSPAKSVAFGERLHTPLFFQPISNEIEDFPPPLRDLTLARKARFNYIRKRRPPPVNKPIRHFAKKPIRLRARGTTTAAPYRRVSKDLQGLPRRVSKDPEPGHIRSLRPPVRKQRITGSHRTNAQIRRSDNSRQYVSFFRGGVGGAKSWGYSYKL